MADAPAPIPQLQPFEITDYSGGMTDNVFDSDVNRYAFADNFLITVDRKLMLRPGTIPFDFTNYLLPGQPRRVDAMFTYINESKLLVNQGRDIIVMPDVFTSTPAWTTLAGPGGANALAAGSSYSIATMGEFGRQLWIANDAQGLVSRVYRDSSNVHQVRTAGLPRVFVQSTYNDVNLLAKCITNANQLRTAMVSHLNDSAQTQTTWNGGTNQHALIDKWSLSYFTAQSWSIADSENPGPSPTPTPAATATNLATLLSLVGALSSAYSHHATSANSFSFYHFNLVAFDGSNLVGGPKASLSQISAPTTLYQAALMLDDLYQKFYWHMFGVNIHGGPLNDTSIMNKYDYTNAITKIGTVNYDTINQVYSKAAPPIAPMYQDFYDYVNGLAALYKGHIGSGGNFQNNAAPFTGWTFWAPNNKLAHTQPDTYNVYTLPLVTAIDQAYLAVYWLRTLYGQQHVFDGNNLTNVLIQFSGTAGSTSLTAVQDRSANNLTLPVGSWIYVKAGVTTYFTAASGFQNIAKVTASGAGTATIDRPLIGNQTNLAASYASGGRFFHAYYSAGTQATSTNFFPSTGEFLTTTYTSTGTDLVSWNAYAQEFMYCLFNHMLDANVHQASNFPGNDLQKLGVSGTPGVTQWYVPTASTIAYAFTYYHTWTVEPNGLQYAIESNPVYSASFQTIEPLYAGYTVPTVGTTYYNSSLANTQNPIVISSIPAIVNDSTTNYATSEIKVKVYRTTSGGVTFYLDSSLTNGTTSLNSVQNSTVAPSGSLVLTLNPILYTSGGVVGNDQPPQCKCIHIVNGTAYYGNLLVNGQSLPNVYGQSIPQNPDGAPATFTDTLEDEVIAISSARSNVIVFCRNSIYRVIGGFNLLGQGALTHERISDQIGCIGAHSVVKTEIGVFFGGNDGFYYTDGFQLIKISIDLNASYARATQVENQKKRVYGAYDKSTRRIWWSMQTNPSDVDCDMNFIYYLDYGVKPSGVFTTASNNGSLVPTLTNTLSYNYWQPSAVIFYQGQLVRGDPRGLLFKTDPNSTTDPRIDLTAAAYTFASGVPTQNWANAPIPWNFTSTAWSMGSHVYRKYTPVAYLQGKNVGNAQIIMKAISDNGRETGNLASINFTRNVLWGDPRPTWGSATCKWDYQGQMDAKRRLPTKLLKATFKQIQLTNGFLGVYRYQDYPVGSTVTVAFATKQATINTPSTYTGTIIWPLDVVDYYLAFSDDGYVNTFRIKSFVSSTVVLLDDPSSLITVNKTGVNWVIRGYKKNMDFEISGISLKFMALGDAMGTYQSLGDSGENTA